jgi:hypothetical protein
VLWAGMLRTVCRDAHRDLLSMEDVLLGTPGRGPEVLVVRAVGLTPEAPSVGCWTVLSEPHAGPEPINLSVAKPDIAQFLFEQAIARTVPASLRAVTLAGPPADFPASGGNSST